jgi:hypothetical protein
VYGSFRGLKASAPCEGDGGGSCFPRSLGDPSTALRAGSGAPMFVRIDAAREADPLRLRSGQAFAPLTPLTTSVVHGAPDARVLRMTIHQLGV